MYPKRSFRCRSNGIHVCSENRVGWTKSSPLLPLAPYFYWQSSVGQCPPAAEDTMLEHDEAVMAAKYYSMVAELPPAVQKSSPDLNNINDTEVSKKEESDEESNNGAIVAHLRKRIAALETFTYRSPYTLTETELSDIRRAKRAVSSRRIHSCRWKWVPSNYYDLSLEERAAILNASSSGQLCKSILVEHKSSNMDARFYLVLLQYSSILNTKKLNDTVRLYHDRRYGGKSTVDVRVATGHDNEIRTGYGHNSVTPFGMNDATIPIILSSAILEQQNDDDENGFLWMGGGHTHLKLGVCLSEFLSTMNVLVANVSDPRPGTR